MRKPLLLALAGLLGAVAMDYAAEAYIRDIRAGKIAACKWVKLAVERRVADLRRAGTKNFPYRFEPAYAQRCVDFIQQLEHTKGDFANRALNGDARIRLEPWEQFIIWEIEGWRRADGRRRFTRAYIEVARKNGKTTFGAALANFHFFADKPREEGPEVYFAATKQEQASLAWSEAGRQIRRNRNLAPLAKLYASKQRIVIPETAAMMRPLGRDSDTEDGLNPSFALIDEYHAHPDAGLIDVLESGMGARSQPLTLIITTAGTNYTGPCHEEHERLQKMLEGSLPPVDHFFGVIYTLDEGDDWKNPRIWGKANPNLGVSVKEDYLKERIALAAAYPSKVRDVKTKNLNIWCQSALGWISAEQWKQCAAPRFDEAELEGRSCYGGMDLSATQDITALALTFPPREPGEPFKNLYRFYMPKELTAEKEFADKVPYQAWIDQGFVFATPGNVVDYDYIEADILAWAEQYQIEEFCYDPYHAQEIVNHMTDAGISMLPIRQSYAMMSPLCGVYEQKVLSRQMAHNGNPVMNWMISCVELKSDRQGNVMPMKPRRGSSGKRIDGVAANVMSLGRAALQLSAGGSVYDERGVLAIL
jgi:phage terminase large subunit-like protein